MPTDPTELGTVEDVNGATIGVVLHERTVTGLSFVNGEAYRTGQVGSFVRIPLGHVELFGVVSQAGAGAVPEQDAQPYGSRWLRVELVGEGRLGGRFQRGISQYPAISDKVHLVTQQDLARIYGAQKSTDFVEIGALASAESVAAAVEINKLVTRHSAIVGTTGAGKSTTVASVLYALTDGNRYPAARVLLLDLHGEYGKAMADRAAVYRVGPDVGTGQLGLSVPYWALTFEELLPLAFGPMEARSAAIVADMILQMKREVIGKRQFKGVSSSTLTVDTPVPFSIRELWFRLHERECTTVVPKPGTAADEKQIAYVLDEKGAPVEKGDAERVVPPLCRTVKQTGPPAERVQWNPEAIGIRAQVNALATKLRDPRFAFLFTPGEWAPTLDGTVAADLDELISGWLGGLKRVSVLDLSGIPSQVLLILVGALLRIVYDALFWARGLPQGGRQRPLLIVLEEAHAYLGSEVSNVASQMVRRIVKEGRKYGVGCMIVSQRPAEVDATILSQCGTIFAMRLSNHEDRSHVTGAVSDNLKGLFAMLPVLRTGEAIVVGEAVQLPTRALIAQPERDRRPNSADPIIAQASTGEPGGWDDATAVPGNGAASGQFRQVVKCWRSQSAVQEEGPMERVAVESSTIRTIGYNPETQVLEVEFNKGGVYQYLEVPPPQHEALMGATSKGQYLAQNIKGRYQYIRL